MIESAGYSTLILTGAAKLKKGRKNMNVKNLLLRAAMLGAILLGIAGVTQPVRASGCTAGVYCEATPGVPGVCGRGGAACDCYGSDGAERYDVIDCAQL